MKRLAPIVLLACQAAWGGGEPVAIPRDKLELAGRLYMPEGKGPSPAIVLLHGCNGMWGRNGEPARNYEAWALHFQKRGFVALLLDSFGPRAEKEICTQGIRKVHPARDRAPDAHAALRWLAQRPEVRADSIHLLGWSNGGISVLHAIKGDPKAAQPPVQFRSAVAYYPNCRDLAERFESGIPLLIQSGSADDWTPARECEALTANARRRGIPVEIDVYEGAHHAFDGIEGRVRFRPEVRNISSPSGRGAHVGPDPAAREKSWARATDWIEAHL